MTGERTVTVYERLRRLFTEEELWEWLWARHPLLDENSPLDLIQRGEHERVLDLLDQMESGAYL